MTVAEAIEKTKSNKGMRVSITGISSRISAHRGSVDGGTRYMVGEFGKHFQMAREAWMGGDLTTVAEFFGIYV